MSEELNQEVEVEAVEETVESEATEEPSAPKGFMSRNEWADAGKDPDDWRSKKTFEDFASIAEANKRLHQKIEHIEKTHQESMINVQTYHNGQLQNQLKELDNKRMEAIELADTEQVKEIEQQMGDVQAQQTNTPAQPQYSDQEIANWYNGMMAAHPTKVTEIENAIAGALQRHPGDVGSAAAEVNQYVATFSQPAVTTPKPAAAVTSKGRSRAKGKLTMNDCTEEEKAQMGFFTKPDGSFDQKRYLSTLESIRSTKQ